MAACAAAWACAKASCAAAVAAGAGMARSLCVRLSRVARFCAALSCTRGLGGWGAGVGVGAGGEGALEVWERLAGGEDFAG